MKNVLNIYKESCIQQDYKDRNYNHRNKLGSNNRDKRKDNTNIY